MNKKENQASPILVIKYFSIIESDCACYLLMDENKSQPLHVTGILVYRIQRQVEFLLLNDTFGHKKYWSAPKGEVIGQEDELK